MATFAFERYVGHKLHLYGYYTGTLALFASSSVGIEGEELGCVAHLLRQRLLGKEVSDGIVGLDVCGRV